METRRWTNPSQPQTLYLAQWLLYIRAGMLALFVVLLGVGSVLTLLFIGAFAAAAYGIANEKRWGYWLGLAASVLLLVGPALAFMRQPTIIFDLGFLFDLVFPVAQLALLVHPQSREYQRIWFR
ncbi:MAG: hypothetical protein MUF83_05110 [Acidimicrobiales bacterium]|jgi:hypothetical protein|nr:hypothetical protein [Acidimicrobiales bacterium]